MSDFQPALTAPDARALELNSAATAPRLYAAFLGLLYIIGYVVATSHYARFGAPPTTLFQVRYVGAGILFLVFAVPTIVTATMSFLTPRRSGGELGIRNLLALLLIGTVIHGVYWPWLTSSVSVAGEPVGILTYATLAVVAALSGLLWGGLPRLRLPVGESPFVWGPFRVASAFATLCIVAAAFGRYAYPRVGEEFGGGAGWRATVHHRPSGDVVRVEGTIIDRSEAYITIVECTDGWLEVAQLPSTTIVEVTLHGRDIVPYSRERSPC